MCPLSEEGSTGATARAWLVMRMEEASQVLVCHSKLQLEETHSENPAVAGVPLSEEGSTGATARAWLVMRTEEASQVLAQRIRLDLLGPDQLLVEPAA